MAARTLVLTLFLCVALAAVEKEPIQEYKSRRDHIAEKAKDGVVVLFALPEEDLVEYRQDPNFYYLTGFDQPNAILLIDASAKPARDYLFLKPRDLPQERWTGPKIGPGPEAEKLLGFQTVQMLNDFPEILKRVSANKTVHTLRENFDRVRGVVPGAAVEDVTPAIAELRQVKSPTEIALLDKAVQITMKGLHTAARTVSPDVWEYEVEAALEFEFRRNGAERPGYPSIVGSGPLSTVLHYDKNARRMEAGDVVVIDVGAEYSGYVADITRTFPVSGKFSPRQREIYQIVLDAQKAAIAEVRPGATFAKIHAAAFNYIKSKGYSQYFIHGTSHHIGLQVHDVGSTTRPMEPGMVITIEPGIYIPEEKLGVRIEDDLLITASGNRVMSTFPKEAAEIESLMSAAPKPKLQ